MRRSALLFICACKLIHAMQCENKNHVFLFKQLVYLMHMVLCKKNVHKRDRNRAEALSSTIPYHSSRNSSGKFDLRGKHSEISTQIHTRLRVWSGCMKTEQQFKKFLLETVLVHRCSNSYLQEIKFPSMVYYSSNDFRSHAGSGRQATLVVIVCLSN